MSKTTELVMGRYAVVEELEAGLTASVFRCIDRLTDVQVVCRVTSLDEAKKQARVLRAAAGPGLVPVLDLHRDDDPTKGVLVLQDAGEITFKAWATTATFGARLSAFERIVDATMRLHRSGAVHGDLHGRNVVIDAKADDARITLIDPGALSKMKNSDALPVEDDASLLAELFAECFAEASAHPRIANAFHNRSLAEARAQLSALRGSLPRTLGVASFVTDARRLHALRMEQAKELAEARIAAITTFLDMLEHEIADATNGGFIFSCERSIEVSAWATKTRAAMTPAQVNLPALRWVWNCETTARIIIFEVAIATGGVPWPGDLPRAIIALGSLLAENQQHTLECRMNDARLPEWFGRDIRNGQAPEVRVDHAFVVDALRRVLRYG